MSNLRKRIGSDVKKSLVIQSGILISIAAAISLSDRRTAVSVLFGGLTFLVPQTWFAVRVFRIAGARAAPGIVKAYFRGEAGKFLITAAMFAAMFALIDNLNVMSVFGAYCAMLILNTVVLATVSSSEIIGDSNRNGF